MYSWAPNPCWVVACCCCRDLRRTICSNLWPNAGWNWIQLQLRGRWWRCPLWWVLILQMGMGQYLLIPFLMGWTTIYQLFWCSPGVQGFDPSPNDHKFNYCGSGPHLLCFWKGMIQWCSGLITQEGTWSALNGGEMWSWWSKGFRFSDNRTFFGWQAICIYIYIILIPDFVGNLNLAQDTHAMPPTFLNSSYIHATLCLKANLQV